MSRTSISRRKKWDQRIDNNAGYDYALVYMISEIRLIPLGLWETIDLEECLEARIFGTEGELHIFREDDELMAVIVRDLPEENMENREAEITDPGFEPTSASPDGTGKAGPDLRLFSFVDRTHEIRSNCRVDVPGFNSRFKNLIIREYIDYDGDGQAYTALTRLAGLQ